MYSTSNVKRTRSEDESQILRPQSKMAKLSNSLFGFFGVQGSKNNVERESFCNGDENSVHGRSPEVSIIKSTPLSNKLFSGNITKTPNSAGSSRLKIVADYLERIQQENRKLEANLKTPLKRDDVASQYEPNEDDHDIETLTKGKTIKPNKKELSISESEQSMESNEVTYVPSTISKRHVSSENNDHTSNSLSHEGRKKVPRREMIYIEPVERSLLVKLKERMEIKKYYQRRYKDLKQFRKNIYVTKEKAHLSSELRLLKSKEHSKSLDVTNTSGIFNGGNFFYENDDDSTAENNTSINVSKPISENVKFAPKRVPSLGPKPISSGFEKAISTIKSVSADIPKETFSSKEQDKIPNAVQASKVDAAIVTPSGGFDFTPKNDTTALLSESSKPTTGFLSKIDTPKTASNTNFGSNLDTTKPVPSTGFGFNLDTTKSTVSSNPLSKPLFGSNTTTSFGESATPQPQTAVKPVSNDESLTTQPEKKRGRESPDGTANKVPSFSLSKPSDSSKPFNFGSSSSVPSFSFGSSNITKKVDEPSTGSSDSKVSLFGKPSETPSTAIFGLGKKSDTQAVESKDSLAKPSFNFQAPQKESKPLVNQINETPKPVFSFSTNDNTSSAISLGATDNKKDQAEPKSAFSFGDNKKGETGTAPTFSFGKKADATSSLPSFSFGGNKTTQISSTPAAFGTNGDGKSSQKDETKPPLSFSGPKDQSDATSANTAPKPFSFSTSSSLPNQDTTGSNPTSNTEIKPKNTLSFGPSVGSVTGTKSSTIPSFNFGASSLPQAVNTSSDSTSLPSKPLFGGNTTSSFGTPVPGSNSTTSFNAPSSSTFNFSVNSDKKAGPTTSTNPPSAAKPIFSTDVKNAFAGFSTTPTNGDRKASPFPASQNSGSSAPFGGSGNSFQTPSASKPFDFGATQMPTFGGSPAMNNNTQPGGFNGFGSTNVSGNVSAFGSSTGMNNQNNQSGFGGFGGNNSGSGFNFNTSQTPPFAGNTQSPSFGALNGQQNSSFGGHSHTPSFNGSMNGMFGGPTSSGSMGNGVPPGRGTQIQTRKKAVPRTMRRG